MESSREIIERARRVGRKEGAARTIAQPFCLLIGLGLIAGGVLGFVFGGADFDTGDGVQGDDFIIFEVNGWHNVVHIVSGMLLALVSMRPAPAAIGALVFGVVYAAVAVLGFADGNDVLDIAATDDADNWLHVGLGAAGVLVGLVAGAIGMSARREHRRLEREVTAGAATKRAPRRRFLRRRTAPPETATLKTAEHEEPRVSDTAQREEPRVTETSRRE